MFFVKLVLPIWKVFSSWPIHVTILSFEHSTRSPCWMTFLWLALPTWGLFHLGRVAFWVFMPSAPNQVGYLYSFPSSSLTVEPFSAVVADRDCFGSHLSQLNWRTKSFPDFLVAPPWLLSPSAVKPVRDWFVCHLSQ